MSRCGPPNPRVLLIAGLVAMLVVAAGSALAQTYQRGFVPPPDYERILEEHRVLIPTDKDPLPEGWDWRDLDAMTPAKNQGDCGSCWAFAAVGELEAKVRIYYHETLDLSEQQIVSCNPYGSGCDGGWAGSAYYVFRHYGAILEGCMPYQASDDVACRQDEYLKFADLDTWVNIDNDIDQIKTSVMQNGPVCTSVDANDDWDGYSGGVIDSPGNGTNHLVLIVGWEDRLGENGAWIVKNSWGASWGMGGYCYVAYGACNIGYGVTALNYTPPPVRMGISSPQPDVLYYGDESVDINWFALNEPVDAVDLYYGINGSCQSELIAENVPNTGSYEWLLPNVSTERATVVVFPSEGTHRGFGFTADEFTIIGHQTRYVSAAGSNQPPYDTPDKAAHSIADAVIAGAGRDSVLVAGGNYLESGITINSQLHILGGWNEDFTVRDPAVYETRIRGVNGAVRFNYNARTFCGVDGVTFHDCQAALGSVPVNGRHGAAIISVNASPVIENCRFENNRADPGTAPGWGGAIMAMGGSPTVRDCLFTGNVGSHGGAVALSESEGALIEDCAFYANATSDSTAAYPGAAIYVHGGQATIAGCEIRGGGAGVGGGLALAAAAQVTLRETAVVANRALGGGAGIHVANADLVVERGSLEDNALWTGNGGGVYATGGSLELRNVLVNGNSAVGLGGGCYAQALTAGTINNCVWHANSAGSGGAGFIIADGELDVFNNIVTANGGGGLLVGGSAATHDWNLAYGNLGDDLPGGGSPHDLVADPLYADAEAGDFAPGLHSPAIDSGSAAAGADWDGGSTDRGLSGGAAAIAMTPHRVTGLVLDLNAGQADLSWNEVAGAVSYAVYRDSAEVFLPAVENLCGQVSHPDCEFNEAEPAGVWYYVVGALDAAGHAGGFSDRVYTSGGGVPVHDTTVPQALAITAVAPNPFNPRTAIAFAVPASAHVRLRVFDLRGRLVQTLQDGTLAAGHHTVIWNGTDRSGRGAATGLYFVRLDDGRTSRTVKVVLAK